MADGGAPARRRGLGMGLSALLGESDLSQGPAAAGIQSVPIEFLKSSSLQPRRRFDEGEIAALAQSIGEKGILQPLLVRPAPHGAAGYEIVAGERRWRAAQAAGLHEVPVLVRELDDRATLEVALIENIQRTDLGPLEEAQGFRRLIDEFAHTQEGLAQVLGKSRSHIANTLRLLALPEAVKELVGAGALTAGHARALLGHPEAVRLASLVVERELSVRETEALVRAPERPTRAAKPERDPDTADLERRLSERLGLAVGIRRGPRGGTVSIRWRDLTQLDGLLRRLL